MNIIQHHPPVDLEEMFADSEEQVISLSSDYKEFIESSSQIHSFVISANGENRGAKLRESFVEMFNSEESLLQSSRMLVLFMFSSEAPITMAEISQTDFSGEIADCDINFGIKRDETLGDNIKMVVLVAVA